MFILTSSIMRSPRFLLLVSAPAGIGLACLIYNRLSIIRQAQCFDTTATAEHTKSPTVALMNPLGHATQQDSYTIRIPARRLRPGISNEEILARFTYGYFGGWIFTPERLLLRALKLRMTHISSLNEGGAHLHSPSIPTIWGPSALSRAVLPPLGSLVSGIFLLLDCSAASPQERERIHPLPEAARKGDYAFAEFVAGSDQSRFVVSERFDVARQSGNEKEDESVTISCSYVICNPLTDKSSTPSLLRRFHGLYARLLFADGIREVMGLNSWC